MAWPFHAKTRHVSIDGCWTVTALEEALLGDMYLRRAFDQDHLGQISSCLHVPAEQRFADGVDAAQKILRSN
jgi:hypothetical protein